MLKYFLFLSLIAYSLADNVIDLTDFEPNEFDNLMKNQSITLVNFYFAWNPFIKQLEFEYEKAATILKSNNPPVILYKVECLKEEERKITNKICVKYSIYYSPDIKLVKLGKFAGEFDGKRNANNFVEYVRSNLNSSLEEDFF